MTGPAGLKEFKARELAFFMSLGGVIRCQFCDWKHEGEMGEGREAAQDHRREAHPELPVVTPRLKGRRRAGQKLRKYDGAW